MKTLFNHWIRVLGFIQITDRTRFILLFIQTLSARVKFKRKYPQAVLPPPYYLYETFNLNYESFYTRSISTAEWIKEHFSKHSSLEESKILDWGCGPGRVIRHLPTCMPEGCEFYGSDYNAKYIKWCSENLEGIAFTRNELTPPLSYENDFFDLIYSISIFTHLSEENHRLWFDELMRVLKPGGIVLLTLHGESFRIKMTAQEKQVFDRGDLVIRSKTKEGHRTYAAFQPEAFVRKLVGENLVLEHIPGILTNGKAQQDTWVIRKN